MKNDSFFIVSPLWRVKRCFIRKSCDESCKTCDISCDANQDLYNVLTLIFSYYYNTCNCRYNYKIIEHTSQDFEHTSQNIEYTLQDIDIHLRHKIIEYSLQVYDIQSQDFEYI